MHLETITIKYDFSAVTIIFNTHPALYYANVGRRKGGKGKKFEEKLIGKAISKFRD
jgi:hypothetical protein